MRAKTEMIALQEASTTTHKINFHDRPHSGILSEKSAIILCGLAVAVFAIPILVLIHIVSGLYWGSISVYQLVSASGLDKMGNI